MIDALEVAALDGELLGAEVVPVPVGLGEIVGSPALVVLTVVSVVVVAGEPQAGVARTAAALSVASAATSNRKGCVLGVV